MIEKKCQKCGKIFKTKKCWKDKSKFCSRECYFISKKGTPTWNKGLKRWWKVSTEFKKGNVNWNKGTKGIMKAWNKGLKVPQISGKKHYNWKGDKVGYDGIHRWVRTKLGKAIKCKHCGKEWDKPRSIHWSNIDHTYKRVLEDYISLCMSCHKKYDIKYNQYIDYNKYKNGIKI